MKLVKNDTLMTSNDQGVQEIPNIHFFQNRLPVWILTSTKFFPHFGVGHGRLFCLKSKKIAVLKWWSRDVYI